MDLEEFDAVFTEIVSFLTTKDMLDDSQVAAERYKEVLEFNVPFGKKARGLMVVKTFKCFAAEESLTQENLHLANILGWCVELLQACGLIIDDIMDQSETRRGRQCWYKHKNLGLRAYIDAMSIEKGAFLILTNYFQDKDYYINLLEAIKKAEWQAILGQTLDSISSVKDGKITEKNYKKARLDAIVKYKTTMYTFFSPVALGMYMAGCQEDRIYNTKPVMLAIGQLFQAQDDYMDCYGDPETTGKIGTDIEDGKCCWLIVKALELASDQQKMTLMESYGKPDKLQVATVKEVYHQLQLQKKYEEYEEQSYNEILRMIDDLNDEAFVKMLSYFIRNMYKREK